MKAATLGVGGLLFVAGLSILALRPIVFDRLLPIVEKDLVGIDYETPVQGRRELEQVISITGMATAVLGLVVLACANVPLRRRLVRAMLSDRVIPSDSIAAAPPLMLLLSTAGGVLISVLLVFRMPLSLQGLYDTASGRFSEGPIPTIAAFALLAAAVTQTYAAWTLRRSHRDWPERTRWLVFSAYGVAAILFFLVGMEELSWGQWLFHWQAPDVFARLNTQNETNLHNLTAVEPYILPVVRTLAIALLLSVIVSFAISTRPTSALHFILPHPSQITLVTLILITAFLPHTRFGLDELVEELISLLILLYSVRAAAAIRYRWREA